MSRHPRALVVGSTGALDDARGLSSVIRIRVRDFSSLFLFEGNFKSNLPTGDWKCSRDSSLGRVF